MKLCRSSSSSPCAHVYDCANAKKQVQTFRDSSSELGMSSESFLKCLSNALFACQPVHIALSQTWCHMLFANICRLFGITRCDQTWHLPALQAHLIYLMSFNIAFCGVSQTKHFATWLKHCICLVLARHCVVLCTYHNCILTCAEIACFDMFNGHSCPANVPHTLWAFLRRKLG